MCFWSTPAKAGPSCAATVMSNANFGSPSLLSGAAINTTATLSFSCSGMPSGTFVYCLSLDAGSGGTSGSDRLMVAGGGAILRYNLYQDAARTIPWGSRTNTALGTIPGVSVNGGSNPTGSQTIYAQISAGQTSVSPGSYSSSFSGAAVQFYRLKSGQSDCVNSLLEAKAPTEAPSFSVTANPIADCTISVGALSFGSQGFLSQNIDAIATMTATCTNSTPYSIGMGNGLTGTSAALRKMTSGANSLTYSLYLDSARTTVWSSAATANGTGSGSAITHSIYGRVPSQSTPTTGTYTDSVVVTLTY